MLPPFCFDAVGFAFIATEEPFDAAFLAVLRAFTSLCSYGSSSRTGDRFERKRKRARRWDRGERVKRRCDKVYFEIAFTSYKAHKKRDMDELGHDNRTTSRSLADKPK